MTVRQIPWTEQPQGPVEVDWGNPLAQGLVYADAGTRSNKNVYGVDTRTTPTSKGLANRFVAGASSVETPLKTHAANRTYFFVAQSDGNSLGRLFDKRVSGAQVEIAFVSGLALTYERVFAGGTNTFGGPSITYGVPFSAAIRYSTQTPTSCSISVNGVSSYPTASFSGATTDNADAYVIGNRKNDNLRPWNGWVGVSLIWDRILTDAEIASLTENPWQIFAPRTQRILSPAAASAYPTLSAATLFNITSTTATPRVTLTF